MTSQSRGAAELGARLLRSRRARIIAYALIAGMSSAIAETVTSPSATESAATVTVACLGLIVLDWLLGLIVAGWASARRGHTAGPSRRGSRSG